MKFLYCCLLFMFMITGNAYADCNCGQKQGFEFRYVRPLDVFMGVGGYSFDVTKRVTHGAADIITAPFKSRMYIPMSQPYRYHPGFYTPGRIERVVPEFERPPYHPEKHKINLITPGPVPDGEFHSKISPVG